MPDLDGGDGFDVLDSRARVRDEHGVDLTDGMIAGAQSMLRTAQARNVDFALLTDRSAACGSQVVSLGCRYEAPVRYRFGVGVATALLLRNGIPVVSQRDYATLERLRAKLDPTHTPDPAARDHHESAWVRANLGDPLASLSEPRYMATRVTLAAIIDDVRTRLGPADADLVRRAAFWMVQAHLPQKDRPDGAPYVSHTTGVAATVLQWCPDAPLDVVIAALLHDSVEDQPETLIRLATTEGATALDALEEAFGGRVRQRVARLTNGPGDYAAHVRESVYADPWVAAIKLADFSANAWRLDGVPDPARRARLTAKYRPVMQVFMDLVRDADESHPLAGVRAQLIDSLDTVWERDYQA